MLGPTAVVAVERPAAVVGSVIAAGLERCGFATMVRCLDGPLPTGPQRADLVVLGARAGALQAQDGGAVRAWLAERRPASLAQVAAVFDVRLGPVDAADDLGHRAVDLLASRGFRVPGPPVGFTVLDLTGLPQHHEVDRAEAWARTLGTATLGNREARADRDLRASGTGWTRSGRTEALVALSSACAPSRRPDPCIDRTA